MPTTERGLSAAAAEKHVNSRPDRCLQQRAHPNRVDPASDVNDGRTS
jgi:hypothetical protein